MEAEEQFWLVGPHGAYLAADGDEKVHMSESKDASTRWTVKSTGGGDGLHFLIASNGRYLASTNRGEQGFGLLPEPLCYAMWALSPIAGSGSAELCNLLGFFGTFLASLNDKEQTLYMSPNNKEWEQWRRVPCSPPRQPAAPPPGADEVPPASAKAGEDTGAAATDKGSRVASTGPADVGPAAREEAETGQGPGESTEIQEAAGLVARRDAQALEALLDRAAAAGCLPVLLGATDADGNTLLHRCASAPAPGPREEEEEDVLRVVELLVRRGACPNAANVLGETPLLSAVRASAPRSLVRKLLDARADPDHADNLTGDTALMEAACMGDTSLCEALLQAKADPSLQNFHGLTAWDLAVAAGHDGTAALPGLAPSSPGCDAEAEAEAEEEAEEDEAEADDLLPSDLSSVAVRAAAAQAALQERCRRNNVPFDILGEQGAEEVLNEVLRLQTLRKDELRREGQALNLQTEHCYILEELIARCRQCYVWQAMPMEALKSECEARAAHLLKGSGGEKQRTREDLIEALIVATWGGATKDQKLSDGRAKGIPVDRLESPEQAAKLIEQLEKFEKGGPSTIKQEYMKRGFAPPGKASKEELLALMREVLLWEALPVTDLRQICRRRGVKVSKFDQPRNELIEMLAAASWEERGIPREQLKSFVVAQGILSSVEGFEAKSTEELEALCKKRSLPVEPRPDRQILLVRLRDALVWEHLPMDELVKVCKSQGVPVEEKAGPASGGHPDAKAPSGLKHSAFTPSPFAQSRFAWGKQEDQMIGRWQYGSKPTEYCLRRGDDGHLRFEGPHSRTGTVSGTLSPNGPCLQCQLTSSDGESVGYIRLKYVDSDDTVISNFKSMGREDWGKDLIASRAESDPLEPNARRLMGRWVYGSKPLEYRVGMTSDGKLSFSGPHSRAGTLNGVLEQRGEWMQAGLTAHDGEMVGLIRLKFNEEDGTTVSNFKSASMTEWGKDTIAKKVDDGGGAQAAAAPPGAQANGAAAGGGRCAERKTLVLRLVKAAEERMQSSRGVQWERFHSKEKADEVFKMVLDLEQLPEPTLRREYERLNLPAIAALTCQQVLEAVRSWCIWGSLPLHELEKERRAAEKTGDIPTGQADDSVRGPAGGMGASRRMPPPSVASRTISMQSVPGVVPRATNVRIELSPQASWQGKGGPLGKGGPPGKGGGRAGALAAGRGRTGAFTMVGRPQARAPPPPAPPAASPASAASAPSTEDRRLDPHDNAVRSLQEMLEHYRGDFSEAEVRKYWESSCRKVTEAEAGESPEDEERRNWLKERLLQAFCVRIYESKGIPARRLGDVAKARRVHQRILLLEKMTSDELLREVAKARVATTRETDRLLLLRRLKAVAVWQELPAQELFEECKKAGINMSRHANSKDLLQRLISRSWQQDGGPGAARPKPKPAPRPQQRSYQAPPRPRPVDSSKMKKEFERLGLPTTAGAAEIRKAYRKLALKYHPDKNPGQAQETAAAKFREVTAAYEALCGYVKTREGW